LVNTGAAAEMIVPTYGRTDLSTGMSQAGMVTPNCYGQTCRSALLKPDLQVSTIENRDACGFKINTGFIQHSTNMFATYAW
jgi:hypothetical protein